MTTSYEAALLAIAGAYEQSAERHGGKSISRIATIVLNRGSFFTSLKEGRGCSARNLDRIAGWFRIPANWPDGSIPEVAEHALVAIGRPALPPSASEAA